MLRQRHGVGTAGTALAVLLVAVVIVAGLAVSRLPAQLTSSTPVTPPKVSGSLSTSTSQLFATVTSTEGTHTCPDLPGSSYSSVNIRYTVPPCTSYTFPGPRTQIEVLNSSKVLPYVKDAYYYDVAYVKGDFSSTTYVILNVTGGLDVKGNWTTSYDLAFVGNKLLNITVQKTPGFPVSSVLVDSLPDRHHSVSFTQQQQRIIQVALSNSTVRGLMKNPPYYVKIVYPYGGGPLNGTNSVQLLQIQGIREINVWVNSATTAVVSASDGSRSSVDCDSNGICVTDPWNVQPDAGVTLPPFLLTIEYSGRWLATVTAYNNSAPSPRFLLYTKTFVGTGDKNLTIPWQSVVNGMTVTATVQKSDVSSSTLTAIMNWTGGNNPDRKSSNANGTSVTVSSSVLA